MCGMYLVFSVCGRIGRWRRGSTHGGRRVREQPSMRHACNTPDDKTYFGTQRWLAILEPSALVCAVRAGEQTVQHKCVLWVGVLSTENKESWAVWRRAQDGNTHSIHDVYCFPRDPSRRFLIGSIRREGGTPHFHILLGRFWHCVKPAQRHQGYHIAPIEKWSRMKSRSNEWVCYDLKKTVCTKSSSIVCTFVPGILRMTVDVLHGHS